MSTDVRIPGTLAEIKGSPEGPQIGAFFDLDGTLIAGYSAKYLAQQRMKDGEYDAREIVRTLGVMIQGGGINPETFEELLEMGARAWSGRAVEDLDEVGLRLFETKVSELIFPEMKAIVRAHQERGHTVVLTSSATEFQVAPVAAYLGIDQVLCNRFEQEEGVLTGEIVRPSLYGPGKAAAVQTFSTDNEVDLAQSYFYADGDEDLALMYLVGQPRPTNPGEKLAKVAKRRGWPVQRFQSRGTNSAFRSLLGIGSLLPISGAAAAVGLLRRDRRSALNFVSSRWTRAMLGVNGVELNVVGRENAWKARPAVFIFNHRNGFDPFITVQIVERDFTAVAKASLRKDPIVGTFGRFMELAFVERSDKVSAVEALKPIEELAAKGLSVIVAPEGTRLDTNEVGPFKKGAFRIAMSAGIPIVPVVLRNAEILGGPNAIGINPGKVDVAVLPPIPTDDWTLEDLDSNIAAIRQLYIDTLTNWPDSDD